MALNIIVDISDGIKDLINILYKNGSKIAKVGAVAAGALLAVVGVVKAASYVASNNYGEKNQVLQEFGDRIVYVPSPICSNYN